jgi:hypothetical protein
MQELHQLKTGGKHSGVLLTEVLDELYQCSGETAYGCQVRHQLLDVLQLTPTPILLLLASIVYKCKAVPAAQASPQFTIPLSCCRLN